MGRGMLEFESSIEYNLSPEERFFLDTLGNDPEVKKLMKDLFQVQMRMEIRKLLIKYNYPSSKSEQVGQTVIRQVKLNCKNLVG